MKTLGIAKGIHPQLEWADQQKVYGMYMGCMVKENGGEPYKLTVDEISTVQPKNQLLGLKQWDQISDEFAERLCRTIGLVQAPGLTIPERSQYISSLWNHPALLTFYQHHKVVI